ncbi:uncharacterized protein LOC111709253 [Eurytemora carolleeae]|uniref:uncharacterized protein LOC111709253 n=1 Tax=Eurytemora carolleeae TaxID=1294199 RepID=UPI000C78487D|nr:uncharacterized protein LOC111709253 [Eurytemora carolleeae]|eukprot:XP_023338648.1 uncharacterized protein LOC111709253 [Eurytemora affinis]
MKRLSFLLTLVTAVQGLQFEKTERNSFIVDLDGERYGLTVSQTVLNKIPPADLENIKRLQRKNKNLGKRQARQNAPNIAISKENPDAQKIAEQIQALFRNQIESDEIVNPTPNPINLALTGLNQPSSPENPGSTQFQLNVNLNLELEHGKSHKVRVPQGELTLMYLPQIRGPTGGSSVELSNQHLRDLIQENKNPSSLVMLPSGGMLLMSLSPYSDTSTSTENIKLMNDDSIQSGDELNTRSENLTPSLRNVEENATNTFDQEDDEGYTTEELKFKVEEEDFTYPPSWKKGTIPVFPLVPRVSLEENNVSQPEKGILYQTWENGEMPVFPHSYKDLDQDDHAATPFIEKVELSKKTPLIEKEELFKKTPLIEKEELSKKTPLIEKEELSKKTPLIEKEELSKKTPSLLSFLTPTRIEDPGLFGSQTANPNIFTEYEDTEIYGMEENEEEYETIKSRYRTDDTDSDLNKPHENINVVIPGQFNLPVRPNGVEQCKKDSSTGGKRVCTTQLANNCNGGFKVGGNCNGQDSLDTSRLPPSEFKMGGGAQGAVEQSLYPFSFQQTNMNMQPT